MHILLVKMSSMGDVLHTLPALSDASKAIPSFSVDWIVEPAFANIPAWHDNVSNVIELPLRQWRKNIFNTLKSGKIRQLKNHLNEKKYDAVIDAQGLLKSAWITKLIECQTHGLDKKSAREPLSSLFYQHKHHIEKDQHAVLRTRQLFAKSLNYDLPTTKPDFGINTDRLTSTPVDAINNYVVFIHATTWATKHYPEAYWLALLNKMKQTGTTVYLPWGNNAEKARAEKLAAQSDHAVVLPKLKISEIAFVLSNAKAVVSVDTGLGHLSAALGTPTLSLYGPTDPNRIGAIGNQSSLLAAKFPCAPCSSKICHYAKTHKTEIEPACYTSINPDAVWQALRKQLSQPIT